VRNSSVTLIAINAHYVTLPKWMRTKRVDRLFFGGIMTQLIQSLRPDVPEPREDTIEKISDCFSRLAI
jgi:hypothetical protein